MLGILGAEIERLNIVRVREEFLSPDSPIPKRLLVRRAGTILLELKREGQQQAFYVVENFLEQVLSNHENMLAMAVADYWNDAQKSYRAWKVIEDICAYLTICSDRLQPKTKQSLAAIADNKPYPEFTDNVRGKIEAIMAAAENERAVA